MSSGKETIPGHDGGSRHELSRPHLYVTILAVFKALFYSSGCNLQKLGFEGKINLL